MPWPDPRSNWQGGYPGTGNTPENPLFRDAGNGKFGLLSASPCIDAASSDGAPDYDMADNARYDDPTTIDTGAGTHPYYDIGAYEYQFSCEGDMDENKFVDGLDLSIFREAYGNGYPEADFNHDDSVDNMDLKVFVKRFGHTGCP